MLLLVAATLTMGPAMAQGNDAEKKIRPLKVNHKAGTYISGFGAAVEIVEEGEDEIYRSHMRLALSKSDTENAGYVVRKGVIVINDEGSPVRYPVKPDNWKVEIGEKTFSVKGQVEDSEGNNYDVSLTGELLHKTNYGKFYIVKGSFSGNGEEYSLYYLALIRENAVQPAPLE